MRKDAVKLLKDARCLISSEERWTKGASSRSQGGRPLEGIDDILAYACSYCALGALGQADAWTYTGAYDFAMELLAEVVPERSWSSIERIVEWNDAPETKHEDVLTAFDWAIGIEEAGGL
jgi:hypothetical protein